MKRLIKKRWFWLSLLTLLVGALYVFPGSRWRIVGWVNGESFYQGRPTSYWRERIQQECATPSLQSLLESVGPPSPWLVVWQKVQMLGGPEVYPYDGFWPPEPFWRPTGMSNIWWEVDPDGFPVLMELAQDDDPEVADYACRALRALERFHDRAR